MLKVVTVSLINVLFAITVCTAQGLPLDRLPLDGLSLDRNVAPHFEQQIRPLLQRYCAECHAPGAMSDIDFLAVKTEADIGNHRELMALVVEQMQTRAMPPADFDQPTDAERLIVTDWLTKKFDLKPKDIDRISPYVVEIHEDRKGHLWFGTVSNGAARYDGETLTWFSKKDGLPSNTVSSITEDKDGNLWLGTHHGICRFDGKDFTVMWSTSGRHDQGEGWMSVFADRAGSIWTSTNKGVFRFNGTSFSEFKLPIIKEEITSYSITAGRASLVLEDKRGNLWFRTDGAGAFKFDGKSFTQFTKKDGLCSNNVNAILEDKEGDIWFACMQSFQPKMSGDGGLCRYNGSSFTQFPEVTGLSGKDIYSIYETKAGDLWIGATNVGAYRYDGKAFTLFDKTDRVLSTRKFGLQSILESQNGTLWFGFSGGLFRFNGQSFFNVTKDGPWN